MNRKDDYKNIDEKLAYVQGRIDVLEEVLEDERSRKGLKVT